MESGYYPAGAEHDPNAPWNQSDPEEREFDVIISQSLSKGVTVNTTDYIPGESGVEYETEYDEEGNRYSVAMPYEEAPDTSDTDWNKAYSDEHLTPLQLIDKFKETLIALKEGTFAIITKNIDYLISECEGWTEDDIEVIRE